ncbi:MAG: AMP-binding protein [Fibrobacter sp.]|nr:AMP-binding protein [Fibrobacter sp.]
MNENFRTILNRRIEESGQSPFLYLPETDKSLSFIDIKQYGERLFNKLIEIVNSPVNCVGTLLLNGAQAAITSLSVIMNGFTLLPINPRLTWPEICDVLEQSDVRIIVSTRDIHLKTFFIENGWNTVEWSINGIDFLFLVKLESSSVCTATVPEKYSLLLFTSGTTGKSKGVLLTEKNLLSNAGFVIDAHKLNSNDVALCVLPLYHINGLVVTLLSPLMAGMAVVMPQKFSTDSFFNLVMKYKPTWFSAVPAIFSKLLSYPSSSDQTLNCLRFARSASAPMPEELYYEFEKRFGVPLIEAYGITEAACQVCSNPVPPGKRKPGSAGIPFGNKVKIVDGEVYVKGPNVFEEYLNRSLETSETLENGWLKTGDLGYIDSDGYLYLTGRKKELINRGGEKFSPREIEEVLHQLPEVEETGVVGIPDPVFNEEVAAFIVLRPGASLSKEQVQTFCRSRMAIFKVPVEVIFLDSLPKGPSGKIQRRFLRENYMKK